MEMGQDAFYEPGTFDRGSVNLNKPPTTVDEYMKQVIVSRESIPVVAVANNYEELTKLSSQKRNSGFSKPVQCTSRFIPGVEWNDAVSNEFSLNRSLLEGRKFCKDGFEKVKLPDATNALRWCEICFEKKPTEFRINPEYEKFFSLHKGIPPTLNFVKSLSDNTINHLILHQISYILKHGLKRAYLQWLHSILLVVKKPLLQDVIAALRQLVTMCCKERAKLNEDEMPRIRELTLFIAIVSIYFGQKDFADH